MGLIALGMLGPKFWIALAVAMALAFGSGWQVATWRADSAERDRLAEQARATALGLERAAGVSAAYQQVTAELRRFESVNRIEVQRETTRVEYRCLVPADGQRLLHDAIGAANQAAAGSAGPVPADQPARDP